MDRRDRRDGGVPTPSDAAWEFHAAPPSAETILYIVFLCALWGGNMVAMKVGLQGVPPLSAAGFRFLLASLSVLLFARIRRVRLTVDRELWPHFLALGALFVAQHSVFFIGLNLISASRSAVFLFTQPVFTVLLAHFLVPGERLTPVRAAGILLSLVGLLVVFCERLSGGSWAMLLGDGLVTTSAVAWALQSVYMKHLVSRVNPFALMRRHQIGQLSAFIFLTPIFGVFLSCLLLGDPITRALVAGLVLVAAGIALVNRPA